MILTWNIRYFDASERRFKNRYLLLDTRNLEPTTKAAIEFVVESRTSRSEREIIKFRHLFREVDIESLVDAVYDGQSRHTVGPPEYFEDEKGKEISLREIGPILTGSPSAILVPSGAEQHDIDLMLSEPKPIPVAGISLSGAELQLLAYFSRDLRELCTSAFMKDGPGSIKSVGGLSLSGGSGPFLETAVSDDEIRSFVTIFRRLYMKNEPASFLNAVPVYTRSLENHPLAKWVAGVASDYDLYLTTRVDFRPFVQPDECTFSTKRLIDVYLNTQYAHQPDGRRQRQFNECLAEVNGKRELLTWMFLTEIWKCSFKIQNAGKYIASWFEMYCDHHHVSPEVLQSIRHDHHGIGSKEKDEVRRKRIFREKCEMLSKELWEAHGNPEGGPLQFLSMAEDELSKRL